MDRELVALTVDAEGGICGHLREGGTSTATHPTGHSRQFAAPGRACDTVKRSVDHTWRPCS